LNASELTSITIDTSARFPSFNYTPTLERVYGVPRDRILHIHGYSADLRQTLILGHGWERRLEDSLNFEPDGPDDDWRVRAGIDYIDDFSRRPSSPQSSSSRRIAISSKALRMYASS
jgi:hypothetical protein